MSEDMKKSPGAVGWHGKGATMRGVSPFQGLYGVAN
jgi:hypothetical protein